MSAPSSTHSVTTSIKDNPLHTSSPHHPTPSSPHPTNPPILLCLPSELRSNIYAPLITTGDLAILRTCKTILAEATPLLLPHAVLRLNLGHLSPNPDIHIDNALLASIQRLDLRINMSRGRAIPLSCAYSRRIIDRFAGRSITRETCLITIDSGADGVAPESAANRMTYDAVAGLTGFRTLVLKIRFSMSEPESEADAFWRREYGYGVRDWRHWKESVREVDEDLVRMFLELKLGPAVFERGVEGRSLRFRPSEFRPVGESEESEEIAVEISGGSGVAEGGE